MFRLLSIISRASRTAARDRGICTAIWSPSKSALKAEQTSGWYLDGAAVNEHRLKSLDREAMEGRRAVQQHRTLFDHLFEDVVDLGRVLSTRRRALLIFGASPCSTRRRMTKGLNSSRARRRGSPHWCNFELRSGKQ